MLDCCSFPTTEYLPLADTMQLPISCETTVAKTACITLCALGTSVTADAQKEQEGEDGEEEENIYAPLEVNDEYDTILNSTKAVAIANRPPAPTPRPESTQVKEDRTPYIAKGNSQCFVAYFPPFSSQDPRYGGADSGVETLS